MATLSVRSRLEVTIPQPLVRLVQYLAKLVRALVRGLIVEEVRGLLTT